jgi:sulfur relay (sulfurtransferase) DsrC/TusE family protein
MALGLEHAVKLLEEHIEILKQNLRFFMANYKVEYASKIITIKRELDKAVQERMKLSEIYYCPNNNNNRVAVSAAA